MKHPIHVVFFDLGNTLLYDNEGLWREVYWRADEALWNSLREAGAQSSANELYGGYPSLFQYYYKLRENDLDEPGIISIFKQLLIEHHVTISEEKLHTAIHSMYAVAQTNWHLEDDAIPTLQALMEHSFRLGIISNSADDTNTHELVDKSGLRPYFEFIISSASFGKRKPHPAIFRAALDYFQVRPEETVMVGDTFDADIVGAQQVGMNTIWITRRAREAVDSSKVQPDAIVSTLSEIPTLLSAQ